MIKSWDGKEAREVFAGKTPKGIAAHVVKAARRRLTQLNAAARVEDMALPPGNRLHKVGGDVWAVRVNDQFRITFTWGAEGPENVWLGDYH